MAKNLKTVKARIFVLTFLILLVNSPIVLIDAHASAQVFKNCTELNKVYPGGVALPNAINKGGNTKKSPFYSKALYQANIKSDRDKDGIACEK